MLRKQLGAVLTAATLLSAATATSAAPTLVDGFESENMSAPSGPAPAVNTSGFRWLQLNYTTVVKTLSGTLTKVWGASGTMTQALTGSNHTCKVGTSCLRFYYPAGNNMSEQRFALGKYYNDLWIRYWIRVPANYSHGSLNNKFLSLWVNTYDTSGTVTWQTRPAGGGSSNIVVQDGGVTGAETQSTPFISVPADRGRWMQVVIHVKSASSSGARDGVIQFYRKWDGETSFKKLHEKLNASTWQSGSASQGIAYGYLMGWANDPYDVNTEWLVDDFTVAADSLLNGSTSTPTPSASPPAAPILRVQ